MSSIQRSRMEYDPKLPRVVTGPHVVQDGERRLTATQATLSRLFPRLADQAAMRMVHLEPASSSEEAGSAQQAEETTAAAGGAAQALRCGVVLSGGQAAGGHNVIIGLHDYLQKFNPGSTLIGFLGGPKGVMTGNARELHASELQYYRNQGGFHLIGSGRDKIEGAEKLAAAAATCQALQLDGLVVIGGDDSNTNAAVLAEHFLQNGVTTRVIGVPKTIDGDLKNEDVAISFGFDTAAKVYAELVGNIMVDAASAKKYYHFIRLMGRAASHLTLEVALQTHPQLALISEEVAARRLSLRDITRQIADMVAARAEKGRNYGVILIPEGLVEHAYDLSMLIRELNELLASGVESGDHLAVMARLSRESAGLFGSLPHKYRSELLEDRDPHGNVQVSHIEMEKLLIRLVEAECHARQAEHRYCGKFNALAHFFGYEGRCSLPSNFDATYTYALGHAAAALLAAGKTGLIATVFSLERPATEWGMGGTPLVSMMNVERRSGKDKPVIRKALVELDGALFASFRSIRGHWALHDCYRSPGPIQFFGGPLADVATITLALERNSGEDIYLGSHDAYASSPGASPPLSPRTPAPPRHADGTPPRQHAPDSPLAPAQAQTAGSAAEGGSGA